MKKFTFTIFFFVLFTLGFSQQQPNLSQHVHNQFLINPAFAGVKGYTSFNISAREQWVGIEGAPKIHSFSAQTRLLKSGKKLFNPMSLVSKKAKDKIMVIPKSKGRVGLGTYVFDDRSGLISRTGINLAYSYNITMPQVQYSFGLAFTGYQLRLNKSKAFTTDAYDPMLEGKTQVFIPDASVGFYMLKRDYYIGFSANQLMQSALKIGHASDVDYHYKRHYNVHAGYQYYTDNWIFEPSILFKFSEKVILQNDIMLTSRFVEKYLLGAGYRMNLYNPYNADSYNELNLNSNGDVIILLGLDINNFFIGYSFDYPLSAVAKGSYGTHEMAAAIKIGSGDRRFRYRERY